MSLVNCFVHLLCLRQDISNTEFLKHLDDPSSAGRRQYLIKAAAHGWVHRPHLQQHREKLLAHRWDIFLLNEQPALPGSVSEVVSAHLAIEVSIPQLQHDALVSQVGAAPKPNLETPPLPTEWPKDGGIPRSLISQPTTTPLKQGELRLDPEMADFLTNSLPEQVKNAPVGLFNLFMYPKGDSSVHEHYMEGFKRDFGDSAGVAMKFMGPANPEVAYGNYESEGSNDLVKSVAAWQDANLVQYDTIWHYAYMLSTSTYAELNKEKVSGLEDTCILLTSEFELV